MGDTRDIVNGAIQEEDNKSETKSITVVHQSEEIVQRGHQVMMRDTHEIVNGGIQEEDDESNIDYNELVFFRIFDLFRKPWKGGI